MMSLRLNCRKSNPKKHFTCLVLSKILLFSDRRIELNTINLSDNFIQGKHKHTTHAYTPTRCECGLGIVKIKDVHVAFLVKLGCKLLSNSENL